LKNRTQSHGPKRVSVWQPDRLDGLLFRRVSFRINVMNVRSKILLNSTWQFWTDPAASLSVQTLDQFPSRAVQVPAPWQSQGEDLRLYSGAAWYRRSLEIPGEWLEGGRVILGFEASDYFTTVWVNDCPAGENEGGYLPFEFDITPLLRPGENVVTVRVDDPPGIFPEVPHGKQGWYGPLSGLWQPVWVESRPSQYISSLQLRPNPSDGSVEVDAVLSGSASGFETVAFQVLDPEGNIAAELQVPLLPGKSQVTARLEVPQPLLWSLDEPQLYMLQANLEESCDWQSKTFGFRTIEARDGRLYLNGELLYLRGALDQDYYSESIYTAPSTEFLEDQIRKAKEMGLNCLRCHIKVSEPRYYEAADRLGMLIWTELPNWSTLTDQSARRGRELLEGIVERDGHHPSIIIWTIINEDWGTDLVSEPSHRKWLKETYHWMKKLDPTRLVVDNSACEPNFHIQTDLDDYHFYRAIPDHRKEWDAFVEEFANRAAFTFCPNGDAVRTGKEPLLVSEFGNWGLPDIDQLKDNLGRDPWWFETGLEWSEGVVYPQGMRSRFHNLGLNKVFGSWRGFVEATQWQQYLAMKYQIEAMRRQPSISGYVITELSDVHWECNGLLDMNRTEKVYHHRLAAVNAPTTIVPDWERVAYWQGEEVCVGLRVSHAGGMPLEGACLEWRVWREGCVEAALGDMRVPSLQPGDVAAAGMVHFIVPPVDEPSVWTLEMKVLNVHGDTISSSHLDLALHPSLTQDLNLVVYTPDPDLRLPLEGLGCRLANAPQEAQITLCSEVDSSLLEHLKGGGILVVLASRAGKPGLVIPGVALAERENTPWDGDWASSFTWLDRSGAFAALPGEPLIDHSFDRVIPDYVLTGWRDWEFPSLVHSGMVVGWVHKPAAVVATRWYGKGRAVISAFKLDDGVLASDPTALHLLAAMLKQAVSG
jgi:hypothetical protein